MGVLKLLSRSLIFSVVAYFAFLSLLIAFAPLQNHLFYLHQVTLTWFKDLNVPESFGFLKGQVTPFLINTPDGEALHAWHILPLGVYQRHQTDVEAETPGLVSDFTSRHAFQLLKQDPEARVVIYLHGTAGCVASGWRPHSYRNLYAAATDKIHVLAFDYRGYGLSTGTPSEEGLLQDAISVVDWVTKTAGVPPNRIVLFGQSLGTAVGMSLLEHFSIRHPQIRFSGSVFVASFSDVATLTSTYRINGVIPILSPLASIPPLLRFLNSFLKSTWLSKDRVAGYVQHSEAIQGSPNYHLTFIHAENDPSIGYQHSEVLFWHAVNATTAEDVSYEELDEQKKVLKKDLNQGGWQVEWKAPNGVIRQLMLKNGVHDELMEFPTVALAVLRAFQNGDPNFGV